MLEIALHAGEGHPNLLWIVIPSILTFLGGLLVGHSLDRSGALRERLQTVRD